MEIPPLLLLKVPWQQTVTRTAGGCKDLSKKCVRTYTRKDKHTVWLICGAFHKHTRTYSVSQTWFSGDQMAFQFIQYHRILTNPDNHTCMCTKQKTPAFSVQQTLLVVSLIIYSLLKWEKRQKRTLHFQREKNGGWASEKARQVFEKSETVFSTLDEQHSQKNTQRNMLRHHMWIHTRRMMLCGR